MGNISSRTAVAFLTIGALTNGRTAALPVSAAGVAGAGMAAAAGLDFSSSSSAKTANGIMASSASAKTERVSFEYFVFMDPTWLAAMFRYGFLVADLVGLAAGFAAGLAGAGFAAAGLATGFFGAGLAATGLAG